jgi:hypothetical protein
MAAGSNIRVHNITFAPQILCRCPTPVKVTLINVGSAAPAPVSTDGKFEVCLHSPAFDIERAGTYRVRVGGGERGAVLPPGRTLDVLFTDVVFLQAGVQTVTACADCEGVYPRSGGPGFEIHNDPHTRPCLTVNVKIVKAAWLALVDFEIDLADSLGNRNRGVTQLCPGGRFVAAASVGNRGCADSPPTTSLLTLFDQNGAVAASYSQPLPPVYPGTVVPVEIAGTVPVPVNPAGAAYSFRLCLDFFHAVQPQCSWQLLCRVTPPLPVVPPGGPGPRVIFFVNGGPVYPGIPVGLSWGLQNDCSDVGSVTARVTLQPGGQLLYDSSATVGPLAVPPLGLNGEGVLTNGPAVASVRRPADPALAAALYQVGAKTLHVEITGTGRNPGPYAADTQLDIVAEDVDGSWWDWDVATATVSWKESYDVGGTLTNRAQGGERFDVNAATFTETDDTTMPQPPPRTHDFPNPAPGGVAAGASARFDWTGLVQDWDWVVSDSQTVAGHTIAAIGYANPLYFQKTFEYRVDLALTDEFGNAYRLPAAPAARAAAVRAAPAPGHPDDLIHAFLNDLVAPDKQQAAARAVAASLGQSAAIVLMFAAAEHGGIFGAFFVALFFYEALALGAMAQVNYEKAKDPPVPDFDYLVAVTAAPAPPPRLPPEVPPELLPLRSVAELLARVAAAQGALGTIEGKLLGARIDGSAEGLELQGDGYAAALSLMTMAAEQLPNAAAEAIGILAAHKALRSEDEINAALAAWRRDGLPAAFRDLWVKVGFPETALPQFEEIIRSPLWPKRIPAFEASLREVAGAAVGAARAARERAAVVLAGLREPGRP